MRSISRGLAILIAWVLAAPIVIFYGVHAHMPFGFSVFFLALLGLVIAWVIRIIIGALGFLLPSFDVGPVFGFVWPFGIQIAANILGFLNALYLQSVDGTGMDIEMWWFWICCPAFFIHLFWTMMGVFGVFGSYWGDE